VKNVMVATDGMDGGDEALDFAIELARVTGADLHVIAIAQPRLPNGGSDVSAGNEQQAERVGADALRRARAQGVVAQAHVGSGEPATAIARSADECNVDLVVCGSRKRGRLNGEIIGGVALQLLRLCAVPVTMVQPRVPDHAQSVAPTRSSSSNQVPVGGAATGTGLAIG
jgi:nucleotide-binding universal stress UspA family protein